jgi:hypothetical protein
VGTTAEKVEYVGRGINAENDRRIDNNGGGRIQRTTNNGSRDKCQMNPFNPGNAAGESRSVRMNDRK